VTVPSSTVTAVKSGLVTMISTDATIAADPEILVSYDEPLAGQQHNDVVFVGDVRREITTSAMVGNMQAGALEEGYTVEVVVSVFRGGDQARLVFERCAALVDLVIAALRVDPTVGGTVNIRAVPVSCDYESSIPEGDDGQPLGRFTVATLFLHVRARI
jgi:hypothetical protein